MSYKLIISIVPRNYGEVITGAASKAGAGGGTIIMGNGISGNNVLSLLGFGQSDKDITFVIVEEEILENVLKELKTAAEEKKGLCGELFCIDTKTFIKSGNTEPDEKKGEIKNMFVNEYELINVIVNKGYAEDAMAAARKAGAGGGTVISARGTAKEGDAKFFGMEIVPEKDMLMLIVPIMKKDDVLNAIKSLPCFSKAGSGIIFSSKAENFTVLGQNQ